MLDVKVVYVPESGRENLATGLAAGVWGWKAPVPGRDNERKLDAILAGDLLVLASGNVQRDRGQSWSVVKLSRMVVTEVTRDRYLSSEPVWQDPDPFTNRIDVAVLDEVNDVPATGLPDDFLDALRQGTSNLGFPVPASIPETVLPGTGVGDADDQLLGVTGSTDAERVVKTRLEQRALRRRLLGGSTEVACDICGLVLPSRLVRAAHIKRRSEASTVERLDLANVFKACTLGCDELFELGFLRVSSAGVVVAPDLPAGDLHDLLKAYEGRACSAHNTSTEVFFAWHRESFALGAQ